MPRTQITLNQLSRMEIDENHRLYWDGELVMTTTKLSLPWWVNLSAIVTGASTLALAIIGVMSMMK